MDKSISQNGYKLIKSLHVYLMVLAFLIGVGVNIGFTLAKFGTIENRVSALEIGREVNRDNIQNSKETLQELKINLKILMEKQGLKYQEGK